MGRIKNILGNELIGGTENTRIYPVTSTKAVYDTNNKDLDTILSEIDSRESSLENKTSELESNKLSKGDLAQSIGSSTTTAMSQDAVTTELSSIRNNLLRVGSTGYPQWEANKAHNEGDVIVYNGQLLECMAGGSPASEEFNQDDWEATTVDQQSQKRDTSLGNRVTRLEERCDKIEDTASALNNIVVQNKEDTDARIKTLEDKISELTNSINSLQQ